MLLGALVGLGASIDDVGAGLRGLGVDGWSIAHTRVLRCGLDSHRVEVSHRQSHHHRTWTSIDELLATADLPDPVAAGARSTFKRLAEVEAAIHQVGVDDVHFHEVGAVDAIIDITGTWLALDLLGLLDQADTDGGPASVACGPVGLGHGTVKAAHGLLPLPAPATADLLAGCPIRPVDLGAETVTPTGAALLATITSTWGPIPAGSLLATARGAGGRDPDGHPNVVTGHLLAVDAAPGPVSPTGWGLDPAQCEEAVVVTTNLDDVTGEVVAHTIARCLDAGANDAWADPIVMKKGRPAVELNVLCTPDRVGPLTAVVLAETATLGLRITPVTKLVQPRRFETVDVRGHSIAVKVGPAGAKPEHDDVARAAAELGLPLQLVAAEALAAWMDRPTAGKHSVNESGLPN
jgi:uncharacterized protein (TIGR00299 family) protein